jgi:signal transduction histidine kinase
MLTDPASSYPGRHESGVFSSAIQPDVVARALSEAETGVWSFASTGASILASPMARRILGFDEDRELPSPHGWLERIHPEDRGRVLAAIENVWVEPGPFLLEMRIVTDAGEVRSVEVRGRSQHAADRFDSASGTVCIAGVQRRGGRLFRDLHIGSSLPCALRPANLGMVAATVVDEMQTLNPTRHMNLVLDGHLDGEWDAGRLGQALASLVARALEADAAGPVTVRISGRRNDVHIVVEGSGVPRRGPFLAREIVRVHGGVLHEIPSRAMGVRFLVVLPRRRT